MFEKIKERIFPFLIAFSALSISASAAFYSVTGLSKLFAGASFAVIIMASSLEISKLVIASLLYQYWNKLNKGLRAYLTIAVVVLILITSAGIYGFLSGAYQETATKSGVIDKQVELLTTKKTSFEKIKVQYETEKQSITENISTLRNALGNNNQSYRDAEGNIITYSSSANRKAYEKQLEVAIQKDEQLTNKIQTFNDSIINLETRIVEVQSNTELASELGPLKYLSNITGKSMDTIINYLLLVIIFVFDPLAISLVIAANFAFAQLRSKPSINKIEELSEEEIEDLDDDENIDDSWGDWDTILEDGLEEDYYPEPNENLKEAVEEYKTQNGIPVMIDPKTGEFFYEEPDNKSNENIYGEDVTKPVNLDLNNDGVIDTNKLQQAFDKADTNNDGYIDEDEAKTANLDPETTFKLNQLNEQVENVVNNVKQYYNFNPDELSNINKQIDQIKKTSMELGSLKNKKNTDDENTITYF
jgi:hypothetical protein